MTARVLVASGDTVLIVDPDSGTVAAGTGIVGRPTCLAADPFVPDRAWCGTETGGLFRGDGAGSSWRAGGLAGQSIMAVTASPGRPDRLWVGTEPSAVWSSDDAGASWRPLPALDQLPSRPSWSFPPRPDSHHVRWIGAHPTDAERLWVAIEAGALVSTRDGGAAWQDRVPGGPYDTHELAVHRRRPESLRVAAGDGYFESDDGGATWSSPMSGLLATYLRSVAIDPGDPATVLVSAASAPRSAYVAGRSDGRIYRRRADGPWQRVRHGWPDPPTTIAPLLAAGAAAGELWATDERGLHRSTDGGVVWEQVAAFTPQPRNLRGLAPLTAD